MDTPRIERMLRAQAIACVLVVMAAAAASITVLTDSFGWSFGVFVMAALSSFVLTRIGVLVVTYIFQAVYYKGDWETLQRDAEEMAKRFSIPMDSKQPKVNDPSNQFMLKIIKQPDNIMGMYMDAPFYEWIVVLGADGHGIKMNFHGTVDLKGGIIPLVPDGCILLPPGILYQVEQPVNTTV